MAQGSTRGIPIDTDNTLAANSNLLVPSQNAVKTYAAPVISPTFTGTVTTPAIIVSSETADRVAIIDTSKNVKSADTTTYPSLTELSYVKGVTSAIQTQLDGKQDLINNMFMNLYPTGSIITLNPYIGGVASTSFSSTVANSNNLCRWQQIVTDTALTIDELYLSVVGTNAGASATLTLYFYDDNNTGLPGTKLQQEISSTGILVTGNKLVTFTSNITLQPGVYWVGIHVRGLDTAGLNPTFYFTAVGTDQKSYATSVSFTNNYAGAIFSSGSSDLVNNPTVSSSSATSLTVPMLKIKIG